MKNKSKIKVGVVILNWNRSDDTVRCIESLKRNINSCNLQILVVDNGSRLNSWVLLKKVKDIKIIRNDKNLGYSRGVNQGIKHFLNNKNIPEFILLLNNDTYCDDDFLLKMLVDMNKDKSIGSISPQIMSASPKDLILDTGGVLDAKKGVIQGNYLSYHNIQSTNKTYCVDWVNGCCNLLRVKSILDVGYLNEKYNMYVEDVEYSLRLKEQKWKTCVSPKSKIYHSLSKSVGGQLSLFKRYYIARNSVYLGKEKLGYLFVIKNFLVQIGNCFNYPKGVMIKAILTTTYGFISGLYQSRN